MNARNGRRWPSRREERALELGPSELMNLLEWHFRNRPVALRNIRAEYRAFCAKLLAQIEHDAGFSEKGG